ncbi:putative inositol monophosphatase 3 [Argiope bruennichi]|uniref:putative inositol monophosphatase 3 n=1 Tax=Argiope bruennichi TaxID=94029 RepID=UPI0024957EAB|nr:putative inositol monophosphatase 3 [Argiope bruennichi]
MNLPFIRINPLGIFVLSALAIFMIYLYIDSGNDKKSANMEVISLKHLLSVCVNAAELGGVKVRDVRLSSNLKQISKGKTKEGANDPMTYGDLLSHRTMLYTLKKSFPHIKIVSEEHDENEIEPHDIGPPVSSWIPVDKFVEDVFIPTNDILVWIDPLDATQEYTENLLEYVTTLVCVAIKGRPTIGVIHQPFENKTIWGWTGKGISDPSLTANIKQLDWNQSPTIIVSRSHAGKVKEVARAAFGPETKVVSAGGAGYKSLQVAQGKADAYIHVTLIKKWDICAGNALLHALGGKMTALDGSYIDYGNPLEPKNEKGLLATTHDHEKFVQKLASLAS